MVKIINRKYRVQEIKGLVETNIKTSVVEEVVKTPKTTKKAKSQENNLVEKNNDTEIFDTNE